MIAERQSEIFVVADVSCFLFSKFQLEKVLRVERKTDKKKGKRFFLDLKLRDCTANKSVGFSEYIFEPFQSNQLYYPTNFQWRKNAPVYLVVTAKNLGRWLHHFIKNMEAILKETGDPNLHFVICDYNSTDINLDEVLQKSALRNYAVLRKRGDYSRTASFNDAISLVKDPQSIIFLLDLHLDIASSLIDDVRKVSLNSSRLRQVSLGILWLLAVLNLQFMAFDFSVLVIHSRDDTTMLMYRVMAKYHSSFA